jgi:branched-chain amino acid transport system substrate-binding protein
MKKLLLATAATALCVGAASAEDVKVGILLGFTGPLESITPGMGTAAEMALTEINGTGKFTLGNLVPVRGDSTCVDAAAATSAAERLVTADGVKAIMGADCSGVTGAVLQNVARPNGIAMISPSATSPALSTAEDDGLFFRTAPSDARQGVIMTQILMDRGFKNVALTYSNSDYGKGLADAFAAAFTEAGGTITINIPHDDGKADYSAEVASLASAGGDILVVAGYTDQGGKGIIRASLDAGAFSQFVLPDGMVGQKLVDDIGAGLNGSFGQVPGIDNEGSKKFGEMLTAAGIDPAGASFAPESYDAAALIALAMAAAGSTDSKVWSAKVMDLANAPGEPIQPGELGKALDLIAQGVDIDYVGATNVELIGPGESAGNYREIEIKDGKIATVGYR